MPLYEYRCENCGVFEEWRSLSDLNLPAHCPTCQHPGKRIFSAPVLLSSSFRLKHGLKPENPEPQIIRRNVEPKPTRVKNHTGGRPWMIGH